MKVIQNDNQFQIVTGNSVGMHDQLPADTYLMKFSKTSGIFLESCSGFDVKEKVYGIQLTKVSKILSTFAKQDRNLGVLLSGEKGMGKSVMMKLTAMESVKLGYPVLIVNENYGGMLVEFIRQLDQPAVILFDEFDKVFNDNHFDPDEESNPVQDRLLSLFDGAMASVKKLFIMSCNEMYRISDYMINRPGRIHYHIRFTNPTEEEVAQYCNDHIEEPYKAAIQKIIELANRVPMSYDTLRAICFEVNNLGETDISKVVKDLNVSAADESDYKVTLQLGGSIYETELTDYSFYSRDKIRIWLVESGGDPDEIEESWNSKHSQVLVDFNVKEMMFDRVERAMMITGSNLKIAGFQNTTKEREAKLRAQASKAVLHVKMQLRTYSKYEFAV